MGQQQAKQLQSTLETFSEQKQVNPADLNIWAPLWKIPFSKQQFYSSVSTETFKQLSESNPRNFSILILHLINRLHQAVTFANPQEKHEEIIRALIILTRILPISFERTTSKYYDSFFWNNKLPRNNQSSEDEAALEYSDEVVLKCFEKIFEDGPIGATFLNILISLCFFPNFTVVPFKKIDTKGPIPLSYAWAPGTGISSVEYYNQSYQFNLNRAEVLSCLLATLSWPLYSICPEVKYDETNEWLDYLCFDKSAKLRRLTPLFVTSLFNIALGYDPVGWGVPYAHIITNNIKEKLMTLSSQVLGIILEHKSPSHIQPVQYQQNNPSSFLLPNKNPGNNQNGNLGSNTDPSFGTTGTSTTGSENTDSESSEVGNQFVAYLAKMNESDYKYIFNELLKLLIHPLNVTETYLPNSRKSLKYQELMVLFWQLIRLNRPFLTYILRLPNFTTILYPTLYYIDKFRKCSTQLGSVYLSIYILLFLSGERDFSISLNDPYDKPLKVDLPKFKGAYVDYLILLLVKLLFDSHEKLKGFWGGILTIIANISPYIKSMTISTSLQLLKVFVHCSKLKFLLKNDNHHNVFFLLQTFNNILQYQYEGNVCLAYAIVSNKDYFYKLLDLTRPESLPQLLEKENIPNIEEVEKWAPRLPISTIINFLDGVLPRIQTIIDGSSSDQENILNFLRKTTPVGILPVPHAILIRHYRENIQSTIWFLRYIWGIIFLEHMDSFFSGTQPRLLKANSIRN